MIGKYINEKSLNREDACRFIANRCKDCELSTYCSDKYSCIEKEKYLIDKYDLDSQLPKMHMRFPETLEVLRHVHRYIVYAIIFKSPQIFSLDMTELAIAL